MRCDVDKVELNEQTFVYANGVINVYRVGDQWGYVAVSGDVTLHADDTYVNKHCAKANAMLDMEKLGIKFGIK